MNFSFGTTILLPPYRDLALDDTAWSLFTSLYEQSEKWDEAMQQGSAGRFSSPTRSFSRASPRYFLLTRGYNTCYCNNIAPGETTRTCRKVGAHAKEKRERKEASPVQQEYNRQMAQAQDIFDRYERGEIGEEDAILRLKAIG